MYLYVYLPIIQATGNSERKSLVLKILNLRDSTV